MDHSGDSEETLAAGLQNIGWVPGILWTKSQIDAENAKGACKTGVTQN